MQVGAKRIFAIAGLAVILGAPSAHAVMIPWSVASVSTTVPGGGGAYDLTVNLNVASSSINLTENVNTTIGLQDFNWSMSANGVGMASAVVDRSLTVGGVTMTIDQDYNFGSTSAFGLIVKNGGFTPAPTLMFDLGNTGIVDVTLLAVTNPGGGGSIGTGATSGSGTTTPIMGFPFGTGLVATFRLHDVVPEPVTIVLLAIGGVAAAMQRWTRRGRILTDRGSHRTPLPAGPGGGFRIARAACTIDDIDKHPNCVIRLAQ